MTLRERIEADHAFLTEFRRDLHRHPELMFEETRTSERVMEQLAQAGIQHVGGLAKGTGVLGWLPPTQEGGKVVALRADMDALPILEETGVPHSSLTPGKMHACGHDGHTTILVGAARVLAAESERQNGVLFVFQPAEEGGGGGDLLCQEGALDGRLIGRRADVIYGLHGWPARPEGAFSTRTGPLMASADQFFVILRGKGSHAAAPELSADPVLAMAHCITAAQSIVSRNTAPVDSAVITVALAKAGTATNIIPETAEFGGTVRTLNPEVREAVKKRLFEVIEGTAAALGVKAEVTWKDGYPVTVNDGWATDRFFRVARQAFPGKPIGEEQHPKLGAEDFSYYGRHVPASFYFVGLCPEGVMDPPGLHHPKFDFNDAVIPDCVEMMCRLALEPVA